jgi:hypothetical protein
MIADAALTDFTRDFVKVPRAVLRLLRRDSLALQLYLVLLDRARYAAGALVHEGHVLKLEAGECVMGRDEIATELDASVSAIRTAKSRLQTLRLIATKTTNRGTIVTLLGYGESRERNDADSPADSPADQPANSPAHRQQGSRQTATNRDERRGDVETSLPVSLSGKLSPPMPVGLKPPAGGRAEAEAQKRIAAGEITIADAIACWEYCDASGKRSDAQMLRAIRSQRPSRTTIANRVEPAAGDAAYMEAPF